jgi:hypothetical protein
MRKGMLVILAVVFASSLVWAKDSGKRIDILYPTEVTTVPKADYSTWSPMGDRQIDTLIYDSGSTTSGYYWASGYKMAMRMSPLQNCKILTIQYYSWRTSGSGTFNSEIFGWTGTQPGTQIGTGVSVPTNATPTWHNADFTSQDLHVTGDFVAAFAMIDAAAVIGYETANSGRCWDWQLSYWSTWNETYFIRAIVEYEGGTPDIECVPNPLTHNTASGLEGMFYCKNVGDDDLEVTDITYAASWIDSVSPDSFDVAQLDSVAVTVYFDTVGITPGTYYDTLWIASNDPDENPYPEAVELTVHDPGVAEVKIIPVAPTVRVFPNPARDAASIQFTLSQPSNVSIEVYDVMGRSVAKLVQGRYQGGAHDVTWNMKDKSGVAVPRGVYLVQLKADKVETQGKLIVTN